MRDSDRMFNSTHTLTKELVQHAKNQDSESIVSRLFFGKCMNVLQYTQNGGPVEKTEDDIFGILPLNVDNRTDLYSAWDEYNFQKVEGYQLNDSTQVDIHK